ncbi:glycosyltransferase family 39 protein [Pseudomonas sp. SCB32]|uniref:ArnT family glycosyltransferase n=1 Tax=Pseudomonas sp. SCB32 TaxID=2653853 RepID=UPI0012641862|nr:glycosyltransferase family 39 protein [Pseudomonas sp. SCB32]
MREWTRERKALAILLGATFLLLVFGLGGRELWGPEIRWADIALQMLQSKDYFDPYLNGRPYYDKPLLSYWLITAPASLFGLNHWTLRASSVLAGLGSVWLVWWLGEHLLRKGTGLLAGWLMATTFYFLFWARVATADMLTVFGVLAALAWYWRGPEDTRFSRYLGFCLLLTLTSLCKGLIGFILPVLALVPHLFSEGRWRRHLNLRLVAAVVVAGGVYAIPFVLSHFYGQPTYGESGLALVFRENVVRFFQPFDHVGPIYTYLLYLPAYTLPWAPLWILGLWFAARRWKQLEPNARWLIWALILLFAFFTASGSRRSYYVLPLVPFAQLIAAWWVVESRHERGLAGLGRAWPRGVAAAAVLMLLVLGVVYPWSNGNGGAPTFASDVRSQAERTAPWSQWRVVMLGDLDARVPMYLEKFGSPQAHPFLYVRSGYPETDSAALFAWLRQRTGDDWNPQRTLIITLASHRGARPLTWLEKDHSVVESGPNNGQRLGHKTTDTSLAYLPAPASGSAVAAEPAAGKAAD